MPSNTSPKVWVITGCSSGFGAELAKYALGQGHKVIATARKGAPTRLASLVKEHGAYALTLDVTAPLEELKKVAKEAIDVYGHVDYLVNNAGYLQQGTIEEVSPEETFEQFNTNVFGLLNVTRAFLPQFRSRKSGVICNIGSQGGWCGFPGAGIYCATKFATQGITEALAEEVKHLGIKVICFNPGVFKTNVFESTNLKASQTLIQDYVESESTQANLANFSEAESRPSGDTEKGCQVMFDIMTGTGSVKDRKSLKDPYSLGASAEAAKADVPVHLPLGRDAVKNIRSKATSTLEAINEWEDVVGATGWAIRT